MDQKRTSHMALMTALARSVSLHEADERVCGHDHLAPRFLEQPFLLMSQFELTRRATRFLYERRLPGGYGLLIARTRHFDTLLQQEMGNVHQVVILGAGYDSRPYRFHEQARDVRFFEVDSPATCARKQEKIRQIFGRLPEHVTYLPLDFSHEEVTGALRSAGYEPEARTFFLWEGVSFYLKAPVVDAMLETVARFAVPGSTMAFDYLHQSVLEGDLSAYGAAESMRYTSARGEPYVSGMPRDGLGPFLEPRGHELLSNLGPNELERRYLTRADGSRVARPFGYISLAHTRIRAAHGQARPTQALSR